MSGGQSYKPLMPLTLPGAQIPTVGQNIPGQTSPLLDLEQAGFQTGHQAQSSPMEEAQATAPYGNAELAALIAGGFTPTEGSPIPTEARPQTRLETMDASINVSSSFSLMARQMQSGFSRLNDDADALMSTIASPTKASEFARTATELTIGAIGKLLGTAIKPLGAVVPVAGPILASSASSFIASQVKAAVMDTFNPSTEGSTTSQSVTGYGTRLAELIDIAFTQYTQTLSLDDKVRLSQRIDQIAADISDIAYYSLATAVTIHTAAQEQESGHFNPSSSQILALVRAGDLNVDPSNPLDISLGEVSVGNIPDGLAALLIRFIGGETGVLESGVLEGLQFRISDPTLGLSALFRAKGSQGFSDPDISGSDEEARMILGAVGVINSGRTYGDVVDFIISLNDTRTTRHFDFVERYDTGDRPPFFVSRFAHPLNEDVAEYPGLAFEDMERYHYMLEAEINQIDGANFLLGALLPELSAHATRFSGMSSAELMLMPGFYDGFAKEGE